MSGLSREQLIRGCARTVLRVAGWTDFAEAIRQAPEPERGGIRKFFQSDGGRLALALLAEIERRWSSADRTREAVALLHDETRWQE
jgi:hypothetical protein